MCVPSFNFVGPTVWEKCGEKCDKENFHHTFLRNCGTYKVETWYTHGQWVDVSCIPEPGCCCSFVPLFIFLAFQFSNIKIFVTLFTRTLGLQSWNLVHTRTMNGCIVYTRIRMLQHICLFISSFFFLSNFQTLKTFVSLFTGTVRPKRWNLVHMWTMGGCIVYTRIRLLPIILPFFFIFLSLQFSNIKNFCLTF